MDKIEYKGHTIKIEQDRDPINPREDDNVGTMVIFGKYKYIGDKHDYRSPEALQEFFDENKDSVVYLPIYLYDHSGITISTSPFSCRWDSGQVGFIYATKAKVIEEYGAFSREAQEQAKGRLDGEVETCDTYIKGEVYDYTIDGELCDDSCGGFHGFDWEDNGLLEYARNAIDCAINREQEAIEFVNRYFAT